MMERTDSYGRWTSSDGVFWQLVEPSVDWIEEERLRAVAAAERLANLPPSREESSALAARLSVVDKVRADELDEDTVAGLVSIFPDWQPGLTVEVGDVYSYDGTLVECLQAHTNHDPTHTPDTTPALWKVHRTNPGTDYPVWVQPDSTNPYNATWDDGTSPVVVRYPDARGDLYVNTHGDGNIWSPADYGWALYAP